MAKIVSRLASRFKREDAHKSKKHLYADFIASVAEGVGINTVEASSNGNF